MSELAIGQRFAILKRDDFTDHWMPRPFEVTGFSTNRRVVHVKNNVETYWMATSRLQEAIDTKRIKLTE